MGIFAIILGIVAVLCALFATFLFGTTGIFITLGLAVIAIVLAILKRKRDGKGGIPGIVISVLAIILAICMANVWHTGFQELHKKAVELMPESFWAQVTTETNSGMMGLFQQMPKDEASLQKMIDEMNELNKMTGVTTETTVTTETKVTTETTETSGTTETTVKTETTETTEATEEPAKAD